MTPTPAALPGGMTEGQRREIAEAWRALAPATVQSSGQWFWIADGEAWRRVDALLRAVGLLGGEDG